jgi:lysophospholipase L1-like esterase
MSKKVQLLFGTLIVAASLVVSLLIIELAIRFLIPSPQIKNGKPVQQKFAERPKRFYIPTTANSLRGNTSAIQKPSDTFRISVVGDSFTFAPKMQYFDAFPFKLQTFLQGNPAAKKIEVRSYGTPGVSTKDEVTLVENALTAQSDLIVLEITLNDPQLEQFRKAPSAFSPDQATSPIKKLLYRSALYRFIAQRLFNARSYQRYIDYHHDLFQNPVTRQKFEQSLQRIATITEAAHVPLVVVVLPLFDFPFQEYPLHDIHQHISTFVRGLGVPFLDLLPRFLKTDHTRLQVVPSVDNHPNEIAHRIIAEELYEFLMKNNLLGGDYSGLFFSYRESVFQREHARRFQSAP